MGCCGQKEVIPLEEIQFSVDQDVDQLYKNTGKDREEAIRDYIGDEPTEGQHKVALGMHIALIKKDKKGAISHFRAALGDDKYDYRARSALIYCLENADEKDDLYSDGAEFLATGSSLTPPQVNFLTNYAIHLIGKGKLDTAETQFKHIVAAAGSSDHNDESSKAVWAHAYGTAGVFMLNEKHDNAKAVEYLDKALALNPTNKQWKAARKQCK